MKKLFSNCTGLNIRDSKTRVNYDLETGTTDLVSAYNVVIEKDMSVARRRSFVATSEVHSIHSIYSIGNTMLGIVGTELRLYATNYSYAILRSDMELGIRNNYTLAGSKTYYSNGYQRGYVENETNFAWEKPSDVVSFERTYKSFSGPPYGTILDVFNGRMYMAEANVIWYSEPYGYNLWDKARGYLYYKSNIQMIKGLVNGMFVSDESFAYHLSGNNPKEFFSKQISQSPAIRGTDVRVDGGKIGKGFAGMCIMWTAFDGIWLGTSEGEVINLTKDKLTFPPSKQGCAAIFGNKYIVFLE